MNWNSKFKKKKKIPDAPLVDIQLSDGSRTSVTVAEESDVSLQCSVRTAKPGVQSYHWSFDNRSLDAGGVRATADGDWLILHRLSRFQAGRYGCAARNSQGLGPTSSLAVQVQRKLIAFSKYALLNFDSFQFWIFNSFDLFFLEFWNFFQIKM